MQIEEMYKAYGVDKQRVIDCCTTEEYFECENVSNCANCDKCIRFEYPPFTAEKQLKLIKLILSTGEELEIAKMDTCYRFWLNYTTIQAEDFPKALAGLVVALKNKLDHAKVKEILG